MNTDTTEKRAQDQPYYQNLPNILQQTTEESEKGDDTDSQKVIIEAEKNEEASP